MSYQQSNYERLQKEMEERLTTQERYRQFAAAARHFIHMFQLYLNPAQIARLDKLLADLLAHLQQNSPDETLHLYAERARQELEMMTALLILQEIQGKTAVSTLKQLIYQARHHWQHPHLIQTWRRNLQNALTETTTFIRNLLRSYPPEFQTALLRQLQQMALTQPAVYLCLILLMDGVWSDTFYLEMPPFPAKNTLEFHLYGGVILSQLTLPTASRPVRQKATQDMVRFLAGTNCLFLVEYLVLETDPDILPQLQHCLQSIHPEKRLTYLRHTPSTLQQSLLQYRTTRHLLRRDVLLALQPNTAVPLQVMALETIQLTQLFPHSILMPLLLRPFPDAVKLKMIAMLRQTAQENPITTLFRALAHSSAPVQPALLFLLSQSRPRMTTLERGLYLLSRQAIQQHRPPNAVGRLFIQLFARPNPAYQSMADWLLAMKEPA